MSEQSDKALNGSTPDETDKPSKLSLRKQQGEADNNNSRLVPRRVRAGAVWISVVIAILASSYAWAISSPLGSVPDEPDHINYSWAVMTGQAMPWNLEESTNEKGKTVLMLERPRVLVEYPRPSCYRDKTTNDYLYDDSCTLPTDLDKTTQTDTIMDRYPMLYYIFSGSLMRLGVKFDIGGANTLLLVRFLSSVLSLSLIAAGVRLLVRRFNPFAATIAVMVAVVPNSQYLFASINPNGLEIALAIFVASCVAVSLHDFKRNAEVSVGLQTVLALAIVAFAWVRPLSLAWAGLLAIPLLLPLGKKLPLFFRFKWWNQAIMLAGACFTFGWLVWEATGVNTNSTFGDIEDWEALPTYVKVAAVLLHFGKMIRHGFATFCWNDTQPPLITLLVWVLLAAVVITAFITGSKRPVLAPRVVAGVLFGSMVVIAAESLHAGFGWQGRYWLPVISGCLVFLVPAMQARSLELATQKKMWLTIFVGTASISSVAIMYNMGRFMYGMKAPFTRFEKMPYPWRDGVWEPACSLEVFLAVCALAVIFSGITLWLTANRELARGEELTSK